MIIGYYIFLLIIIFLVFSLMKKNMYILPIKIKIYMQVVIGLILIRYLSLIFISISNSGKYIYLLKPILFLNYLSIPLISLVLMYVYLRWDKISFNITYAIAGIMIVLYLCGINLLDGKIMFNSNYGYIIKLNNEMILFVLYLIIIGIMFLFSVYYLDKPNSNKKGMTLLIIAFSIVLIENTVYIGGVKIFPYPIIGDGIFLGIVNLAVNTFKK